MSNVKIDLKQLKTLDLNHFIQQVISEFYCVPNSLPDSGIMKINRADKLSCYKGLLF